MEALAIKRATVLPRISIGKSCRDNLRAKKDLTIVIVPYEGYSSFPHAVDYLYKTIDFPFNLIIVEGNAPDHIRYALEKRERRHLNMMILYTKYELSMPAAYNLAIPHIRTPFTYFIDNDVRAPKGAIKRMLQTAKEGTAGIIGPKNSLVSRDISLVTDFTPSKRAIESFGIRPCFLIRKDVLDKLGRFDEEMNPLTAGLDIALTASSKGIGIYVEHSAAMESEAEHSLRAEDQRLYSFQWNESRLERTLKHLELKWGMRLEEGHYMRWFESKKKKIASHGAPVTDFALNFLSKWIVTRKNENMKGEAYRAA